MLPTICQRAQVDDRYEEPAARVSSQRQLFIYPCHRTAYIATTWVAKRGQRTDTSAYMYAHTHAHKPTHDIVALLGMSGNTLLNSWRTSAWCLFLRSYWNGVERIIGTSLFFFCFFCLRFVFHIFYLVYFCSWQHKHIRVWRAYTVLVARLDASRWGKKGLEVFFAIQKKSRREP